MLLIRRAHNEEFPALVELFFASVHAIAHPLYQAREKAAWAPAQWDEEAWVTRFKRTQPWVICQQNTLLGFAELLPTGHIDCFYIAPTHQGVGVGQRLYAHLETQATLLAINELSVDASAVALPFFERQGFRCVQEQQVERAGGTLTNYAMQKTLAQ